MIWQRPISLTRTILSLILIVISLSFLVIGYLWIDHEYDLFALNSRNLREGYVNEQKIMIRLEVEKAVDFINYMKAETERRLMEDTKNRVYEAYSIAMNIYRENRATQSEKAVRKMIKDALRPIRFNHGRGYYFATNLNGIEELFADRPEMEGVNMLNTLDIAGQKVIRDMIASVNKSKEGFYRYYWSKPNEIGNHYEKIAFIKLFEPYRYLIGTGEYVDDVKADIQKEVLKRLVSVRFGNNGYLFGSTLQGDPLFTNGKITVNSNNIWELTDPKGIKIIQAQKEAAIQPGGGFYSYSWKKLTGASPSPKISFSMSIPGWEWMIGAGVYTDEIESVISQKREILRSSIQSLVAKIILTLCGLLAIAFGISRFITSKTKQGFERISTSSVEAFSKKVENRSNPCLVFEVINLLFSEFSKLALIANIMVKDRLEAHQALVESEVKYRSLFENTVVGVCILDFQGAFLEANESVCQITGYGYDELLKMNLEDLFAQIDDLNMLIKSFKKELPENQEILLKNKQNNLFWASLRFKRIVFNKQPNFLVSIVDITEKKKAEEVQENALVELEKRVAERTIELEKAKDEAERANRVKSEFLANISHEIRNPMHHVLSYSSFGVAKIDQSDNTKLLHYFKQISKSANRLMLLLNDLLDLSKMEAGKMEYDFQPNNLHAIIKEVYAEFESSTQMKDIPIKINHPKQKFLVSCDAYKISQVVRNLLSNAIKFSDSSGEISIDFEESALNSQSNSQPAVKVKVRDQGIGIPEAELNSIFEKFTQSSKTKTGAGGTGLGLAISKEIITAHSGKIGVENNQQGGALFYFLLPLV